MCVKYVCAAGTKFNFSVFRKLIMNDRKCSWPLVICRILARLERKEKQKLHYSQTKKKQKT